MRPSSATDTGRLAEVAAGVDTTVGRAFAAALARRDFGKLETLLDETVEFRALTPSRCWEPATRAALLDVLRTWFGTAEISEVMAIDSGIVGDRATVTYRFRGTRDEQPFVIEQHACYDVADRRITWMRLLCSGFRTPA